MALSGPASLPVKGWIFSVISSASTNRLSLVLFFVFASSMVTLAFKALLLYRVFLPFVSPAFFWSSYKCWHLVILFPEVFLLHNLSLESAMVSSAALQVFSDWQMQPSHLVLVLSCQYTGWERWWLHPNPSCTCLGVPLLWWLLLTTCHTWCRSTGIKLLILDQGLGTHIP